MSGHQAHGGGQHDHGSDTGAAFMGLVGGALFIGLILYGIVLLTNRKFENDHGKAPAAEHKAAVTTVIGAPVG